MKHLLALSLLPLLVACNGGSDPDADLSTATTVSETNLPNVADQLIDDGNTLGEMLARVDSSETAEQVRPAIEKMVEEYQALFAKMETMESPSFSDMTAMASRAPKLVETQRRVATEIQRIYNDHPEAADVLRTVLDDLGQQQ
ncbi:MAG: hypothetical protein ACSHX3_07790 [Litorimonas sp.]